MSARGNDSRILRWANRSLAASASIASPTLNFHESSRAQESRSTSQEMLAGVPG